MSFSAVVVMEVLAAVAAVSDELVQKILPYFLDEFKKGAAVEYQVQSMVTFFKGKVLWPSHKPALSAVWGSYDLWFVLGACVSEAG